MAWTLWKHMGTDRKMIVAEGNCPITFLGDRSVKRIMEVVS